MSADTKNRILACARKLFQERGYNDVSMRDIADAAGIQIGNLTYHYRRKEQLLEALILQPNRRIYKPDHLCSIQDFTVYFRHLLQIQREASFYFDSYIQISQISRTLANAQKEILGHLRSMILEGLENLARQGEIPAPLYEEEFADRTEIILDVLMLRLPGCERRKTSVQHDEIIMRQLMTVVGAHK